MITEVVVVVILVVFSDVNVEDIVVKVVASFELVVTCVGDGEGAVVSVDVNKFVVDVSNFVDKAETRPT